MSEFVVKDSGARQQFSTGAQRDVQDGKPDLTLVPWEGVRRLALHMGKACAKYGRDNWRLGMPITRCLASLCRHVIDHIDGDRSEDHLAAVMFNAGIIMQYEKDIAEGRLDASMDDRRAPCTTGS